MRESPGPCPICGAAHTACTTDTGPIAVAQLPARDAAGPEVPSVSLVAEMSDGVLGDGSDGRSFSTATYRGKPKTR